MKILNVVLRVVLCLLLVSPILGALGVFPPPTAEMYGTPEAFAFVLMLYASGYILWVMALVFAVAIGLTIANRMAAAALLILPITVCIIGFHAFVDTGLFSAGAIMGNVLALINLHFLWRHRGRYALLLAKSV